MLRYGNNVGVMINMARANRELMGTENLHTLIPRMAVPTVVAQLITTFYNVVDTYFVSQLGTSATAAVGVNNSLERTITMVATLIGAGACSYISRLLGQRRDGDANRAMSTSVTAALAIGVLIALVGRLFLGPLVDFLGATEDCRGYSIEYGSYVLYAAPFMIGSFIFNMCLRSEGSSTYAMIGMGVGGVLNCFLDPVFIFGLSLGVKGASIATAISKFISFGILLLPYLRKKTSVKLSLRFVKIVWEDVKEIVSIGMASFLRSALNVVALVCLNRKAGSFSTEALAALSVSTRVMMFPFSVMLGIGQGYQPVVGYNWGAKKFSRVRQSLQFTVRLGIVCGLVLGAALFAFARPLVGLFNPDGSELIYRYGILAVRVESVFLFIHGSGAIINMFYAGVGLPKQSAILSTARQGYCFIPLVYLLPLLFGVEGLCISQGAADVLNGCILLPMYIKAMKLVKRKTEEFPEDGAENAG